ncbi:MAG: hypothetical protein AAFY26_23010 [Cyanobacteria bacterium J06638_22]
MVKDLFSVENKVVCISGSSRGLGKAIAHTVWLLNIGGRSQASGARLLACKRTGVIVGITWAIA